MPVIQINALPQKEGVDIPKTIQSVATAVARTLDVPEHAVFCTWNELKPDHFVEGPNPAPHQQPDRTHPPIVSLTLFQGRSQELIEAAITTIANELQKGLKLTSPNAFIYVNEGKSGEIFTGGTIKR